jgi:glycine/D-amino acid oxidase-like deaminating enzyme
MADADIIVIGSGHNGLVAAAYLAVAGKQGARARAQRMVRRRASSPAS